MISENSKKNAPHKFRLILEDKLNLRDPSKTRVFADLSIYYTWKSIKSASNNIKLKISAPTWKDKFHLPDGSYFTSDIQDYFEFIVINTKTLLKIHQ